MRWSRIPRQALHRSAIAAAVGVTVLVASGGTAEARRKRPIDPRLLRNPLVLTAFVQEGRLDVRRNEPLVFRFASLVQRRSVDSRSIQVSESTGTGLRPAAGALIVRNNTITFDPTRTQRNYDASRKKDAAATERDRPAGLRAFADHVVRVPGPPGIHVLRNRRGEGILQGFDGGFRTGGVYDDPVPGQPFFVGDGGNGQLGFEPPMSGATGLVDEDAVVLLEFSEPIAIETLDPSSSVLVRRVRLNEPVPGFVRTDPGDRSGRRFQFVPSLGFGSDLANGTGWDVEVTLTTGITDLAGNPLRRSHVAPPFRTRFVPGKPAASLVRESFDDQVRMDPVTVADGGEWNTKEGGACLGGDPSAYPNQSVIYTSALVGSPSVVRTIVNDPLVTGAGQAGCVARPAGSRVQMLYVPGDVGVAAAITSIGWGPSSNALFGTLYDPVTLQLGHSSLNGLGSDFAANTNVGSPVRVYEGSYSVPQAKNIQPTDPQNAAGVSPDPTATGFWPWPGFTAPFEWNGTNNLVVDAAVQSGTTCQILRIAFIPGAIAFPNRRALATNRLSTTANVAPDPVVYDLQFRKRRRTTRATSRFYELAADDCTFADPVVSPVVQPGGVLAVVEVEGAHARPDPLVPGGISPDPTRSTGWTTDVRLLEGYRFLRFRLVMVANLASGQSARVTSVEFPYVF